MIEYDDNDEPHRTFDYGPFDARYCDAYDQMLRQMARDASIECGPDSDSCDLGHRCENHESVSV